MNRPLNINLNQVTTSLVIGNGKLLPAAIRFLLVPHDYELDFELVLQLDSWLELLITPPYTYCQSHLLYFQICRTIILVLGINFNLLPDLSPKLVNSIYDFLVKIGLLFFVQCIRFEILGINLGNQMFSVLFVVTPLIELIEVNPIILPLNLRVKENLIRYMGLTPAKNRYPALLKKISHIIYTFRS